MMVAVSDAKSGVSEQVDGPSVVADRLEAFGEAVLAGAMNRPVQLVNGGAYLRGLIEHGARKSLEPMVERLGGDADYQSLQQFLADSPWDPAVVVRAVAERVVPVIDVEAPTAAPCSRTDSHDEYPATRRAAKNAPTRSAVSSPCENPSRSSQRLNRSSCHNRRLTAERE
jgi:hypothetical protein